VTPSISYKIQKTCCSIFKYAITTFISIFRYAQTAAEPFHISKACIEPSSLKKAEGHGLTSVYLESESEEFLLCTLSAKNLNENLDLNFNKGEKICVRAEVSKGVFTNTGLRLSNYRGWKPTHLTTVFALRTSVLPPDGTTMKALIWMLNTDVCRC
jgi:Nucleoplasmin-like domain